MDSGNPIRSAAMAATVAALAALACPSGASAQYGIAGPYGPSQNYGYYGGTGPYGWGPYAFGWGGYSIVGYTPPMPPINVLPEYRVQIAAAESLRPRTAADVMRQQAETAAWRDRQREALRMQTKVDVSTGLPRAVAGRAPSSIPLDRRLEALFGPDGSVRWPAGLASATPAARRAAEQAARIALEQYRAEGRADLSDVAFARDQLGNFAAPIFAQLAALDDPLAYQAAIEFFQRLDAALIDLASPPAPPPDAPAEAGASSGNEPGPSE